MERFLKSRYRIGDKIGENPFSVTYKGFLMGTEVPVVIKIYKRSALNSPLINKLRPKVTKIVSLDHKNIARVIDGDYGWQGFYFVREFIEGENLEDFISKGVPAAGVAVDLIKQVLSALQVAHAENLIHGAVNSRNIFVVGDNEAKLTDFILEPGVRISPALLAEATAFNSSYMSPEQIKGEQVNAASDIYSTGLVLYRLLTGVLPFSGSGGLDTALQQLSQEIEPPSRINSGVPAYLDNILLKMLEKDPLQRIGNAADALESLEKQRLIFKLPSSEFVNLIYQEDEQPIIYQDDPPLREEKKARPASIGGKTKRIPAAAVAFLFVLIAIAAGLWYAFILNFVSAR